MKQLVEDGMDLDELDELTIRNTRSNVHPSDWNRGLSWNWTDRRKKANKLTYAAMIDAIHEAAMDLDALDDLLFGDATEEELAALFDAEESSCLTGDAEQTRTANGATEMISNSDVIEHGESVNVAAQRDMEVVSMPCFVAEELSRCTEETQQKKTRSSKRSTRRPTICTRSRLDRQAKTTAIERIHDLYTRNRRARTLSV